MYSSLWYAICTVCGACLVFLGYILNRFRWLIGFLHIDSSKLVGNTHTVAMHGLPAVAVQGVLFLCIYKEEDFVGIVRYVVGQSYKCVVHEFIVH